MSFRYRTRKPANNNGNCEREFKQKDEENKIVAHESQRMDMNQVVTVEEKITENTTPKICYENLSTAMLVETIMKEQLNTVSPQLQNALKKLISSFLSKVETEECALLARQMRKQSLENQLNEWKQAYANLQQQAQSPLLEHISSLPSVDLQQYWLPAEQEFVDFKPILSQTARLERLQAAVDEYQQLFQEIDSQQIRHSESLRYFSQLQSQIHAKAFQALDVDVDPRELLQNVGADSFLDFNSPVKN